MAGRTVFMPYRAFSYVGRLINEHVFPRVDKTEWGQYIAERCHRIGGGCFVGCDLGYIGFAVEQLDKGALQLGGALATIPAHVVTSLFGDRDPFILQILDRLCHSKWMPLRVGANWVREPARQLARQDQYIIPSVWGLLSFNGFSMAAAVLTHPVSGGGFSVLHALQNSLQFMQGSAIFLGCLGFAANQYLLRSDARRAHLSQDQRVYRQELAQKLGHYAVELFSSCTVLTAVTAVVFGSPSLALAAGAAFVGNYCQHHMKRAPNRALRRG